MNRILILSNIVLGIAMAALAILEAPDVRESVLVTLGVFMFAIALTLEYRTRALANSLDRMVDERERARRDHAHRIAYWTLSFPIGFLGGMIVARLQRTWGSGEGLTIAPDAMPVFLVFFWLALLLFLALPTAIIAWTEPQPLDDDIV
ncbi:MAG: hypothetical protein V2J10_05125 [Wenzhouxiangella sp.]|jgi:hypothetical protein|nr:hypothetical protein [Wenzhouxiangella sp.]